MYNQHNIQWQVNECIMERDIRMDIYRDRTMSDNAKYWLTACFRWYQMWIKMAP